MTKSIFLASSFIFFGLSVNGMCQTQYYSGTSDGDNIKAKITWKADETISGSYYFTSNSSRVYKLSGTNYVDGELEVVESFNGKRTGSGFLYKTLKESRIIWSGYIYNNHGTKSYVYLTRSR
jgi:hypothetical protein